MRIEAKAGAGLFDLDRLSRDIAFAQHPFVPVLHQFEALCGEPAAGFIHWGATTQNIFDTAPSLQISKTNALLITHLDAAIDALCALAAQHKHTVHAGRTHGHCKISFVASMDGAIGTYAGGGLLGRAVEAGMAEPPGTVAGRGMAMRASTTGSTITCRLRAFSWGRSRRWRRTWFSCSEREALLPKMAIVAVSVAETLPGLSQGLVVHPDAMPRNLDLSNGLVATEALMMRLAQSTERHEAHQLLYEAAQRSQSEGIPYVAAIEQHPLLARHQMPEKWSEAFTPQNYIGASAELVADTVERARRTTIHRQSAVWCNVLMPGTPSELERYLDELARDAATGARVPSIRDLMRRFGVSQVIVTRAFDVLRDRGRFRRRWGAVLFSRQALQKPRGKTRSHCLRTGPFCCCDARPACSAVGF